MTSCTEEVRRSCHMLMADPPTYSNIDEPCYIFDAALRGIGSQGSRSVGISSSALDLLASQIAENIQICSKEKAKTTSTTATITNSIVEWDEDGWHYTGRGYKRSRQMVNQIDANRVERVLLYILALDCINFCFWPTSDTSPTGYSDSTSTRHPEKNLLEYEHLATALRLVAQLDDNEEDETIRQRQLHPPGSSHEVVLAEKTYAFSPPNLMKITPSSLQNMIKPHLPTNEQSSKYIIPNLKERSRLLNELGKGLLVHFDGSATAMLQSCTCCRNQQQNVKEQPQQRKRLSARRLVDILTSTFRGFRDEAIDGRLGRQVCFYKRAQICVGDIWAAFGRGVEQQQQKGVASTITNTTTSFIADFDDIDQLTTFADYRVPQLLRHLGVLRYSPDLTCRIDQMEEIGAGTLDELYIRGGTVVAVERLVDAVKSKLRGGSNNDASKAAEAVDDHHPKLPIVDEVNAVLMDWHLWQVGERLDRSGELKPHHRTRTIFY